MSWRRQLAKFGALFHRSNSVAELDEEIRAHLAMEKQENLEAGMTPEEAHYAALRRFGNVTLAQESSRETWVWNWVETRCQDMRHAARTLAAHRGFTLAAAGMLALAIGITTAMFTVVDSLVLRPVPFRDAEQLAHLWMGDEHGGVTLVSPEVVRAWRDSPAFEAVESAVSDTGLLEAGNTVVTRVVATVTPGVFRMLGGVRPLRGRLFDASEGSPGHSDPVLVSETVWRALFGSDEAFVGRRIRLNGETLTVIGILPADFSFPSANTVLWRPIDLSSHPGPGGWNKTAKAYVRFASGVPREDALRLAAEAAHAADSSTARLRPWVYPLVDGLDPYSNRAVPLLAGGVMLVFVLLCANVCSLLLARLTVRRREFSMRAALGASRMRLMQQALIESGVLGALGVAFGAVVAWALVSLARALMPMQLLSQTLNPLNLNERALAASALAGLVATLGAGLLPAWLGTKVDPGDSLRVVDRSGTEARGARALTRSLLVGEVALACTLLVAATLLTRSFVNLATADRGFDTSGLTTLWLVFDSSNTGNSVGREVLARNLEEEFRQIPGVKQLAWSYGVPPRGGMIDSGDWISDLPSAIPVNMTVVRYIVSPEFFSLYGIPIIRGRAFIPGDTRTDVIVSERFAQALWPGADPLGRNFHLKGVALHVVGVAREIHYPAIGSHVDSPELYQSMIGFGNTAMVSLRCGPNCPEAAVIRYRLASTHPSLKVTDAGPVERFYAAQLARPRATAALAVAFAAVAILAAAGGLFSVLSYAVSRRRREFGIRAALGASPDQIRRLVLRAGLLVAAIGLAIGSLLAAALARVLASLQYGITTYDPLSWSIVLGVIVLTTVGACWGPARAAGRLDPQMLMREE